MKKKFILLLILILLFAGFIGVRFFMLNNENASGRIKIVSSPSSSVFIDNVAIGSTPYEGKQKVGEYMIRLIPEGDATATASWQGKVQVYKNALTYVNRELGPTDISSAGEVFTVTKMETKPKNSNYGEIYVETDPAGAIVYLDNDEKGVAPLILADVLKGDHELSVFMPGFLRRTQKVNIDGTYRVNSYLKLAIDQSVVKPTEKPKESTDSADTTEETDTEVTVTPGGPARVTIKETETGWLRVREEPKFGASESAKVKPGQTFDLLDEQDGWYKIKFDSKEGWIAARYAEKAQ